MPFPTSGEFGGQDQPGAAQFDPATPQGVERYYKHAQMIAPGQPDQWAEIAKRLEAQARSTAIVPGATFAGMTRPKGY